jgi:hypothetical protein
MTCTIGRQWSCSLSAPTISISRRIRLSIPVFCSHCAQPLACTRSWTQLHRRPLQTQAFTLGIHPQAHRGAGAQRREETVIGGVGPASSPPTAAGSSAATRTCRPAVTWWVYTPVPAAVITTSFASGRRATEMPGRAGKARPTSDDTRDVAGLQRFTDGVINPVECDERLR